MRFIKDVTVLATLVTVGALYGALAFLVISRKI